MLIGFVAINVIWLLIDFIVKINIKRFPEIIQGYSEKGFQGFIKRNWKILLIDSTLILGMLFTCLAYQFDWFNRETRITQTIQEQKNRKRL